MTPTPTASRWPSSWPTGAGNEVTLVSMAPDGETSGLRTALAMGAAKAILVSDPALAGSDALGTAKVLAAAIDRAQPDLVLAATESTDGYTGTLPVQVAELLGLPSVTFAKSVAVDGQRSRSSARPRPATTRSSARCRPWSPSPPVWSSPGTRRSRGSWRPSPSRWTHLTVADLGIDAGQVGAAGARQEITDVSEAEARAAGEIVVDEGDGAERIVAFLEQLKVI